MNARGLEISLDVSRNTFADVDLPDDARGTRVDGRRRPIGRHVRIGWGRHVVEVDR